MSAESHWDELKKKMQRALHCVTTVLDQNCSFAFLCGKSQVPQSGGLLGFFPRRLGAFDYESAIWRNLIIFSIVMSLKYSSGMFWIFLAKSSFCVSRKNLSGVRNLFLLERLQMSA